MESKVNYTLVGLFVLLLFAGLVGFVYWLEDSGGKQKYRHYHVYMAESVAGLSTDSAVRYRGVEVGTVERIGINADNPEEVELLLKIRQGTPIKEDTTASLKFFGITGLVYIELSGSSRDAKPLQAESGTIPVIPATPSTYSQIDESLRGLAGKTSRVLSRLDVLLSEKNLQNIEAMLAEITMLSRNINAQMAGFQLLLENGVIAEKRMSDAFEKLAAASESVDRLAGSLQENYADPGYAIHRDVEQSLASFNQLLLQLNNLTMQLQATVQSIENSPGDLLFKRSEIKPGPGEQGYEN
ncbi:MAG TPA: MCE family protein [Gammaproteobacteria bacterium]|nr:MCE family protein [Gammaproteobacteria bacterium]